MVEKHIVKLTNGDFVYEIKMCVHSKDSHVIKDERYEFVMVHYPCHESHCSVLDFLRCFPNLHELEMFFIKNIEHLIKLGYE